MTRLLVCIAVSVWGIGCGGSGKQASTTPEPGPREVEPPDEPAGEEYDDGIQIGGQRGVLEPGEIEPVIKRHSAELADCFAENTRKLPYVGGQVVLGFRVNADGTVKRVQASSGDLGAWPVEKCLLGVSRTMTFPRPKGNGEADFSFPIDFPARSAPTADTSGLGDELAAKVRDLAACDQAVGGSPGAVTVIIYVGVKGAVKSAGFITTEEAPFPDEWADCAMAKALEWKLTDPRGKVVKTSGSYPQ
jgi:hypothetical protein